MQPTLVVLLGLPDYPVAAAAVVCFALPCRRLAQERSARSEQEAQFEVAIKQAWEDRSLAEDRAATLQANHAEQGGDLARERQRRLGERPLPHTAVPLCPRVPSLPS